MVVILIYPAAPARHLVVNVGGCSLTTSRHSDRILLGRALGALYTVYGRAFQHG